MSVFNDYLLSVGRGSPVEVTIDGVLLKRCVPGAFWPLLAAHRFGSHATPARHRVGRDTFLWADRRANFITAGAWRGIFAEVDSGG